MGLKRWYDAHVMPRLIACACGEEGIERRRREIVPLARGRVLELGCGGGLTSNSTKLDGLALTPGSTHAKLLEGARAVTHGWDVDIRARWPKICRSPRDRSTRWSALTRCVPSRSNAYSPRSAACWPRVGACCFSNMAAPDRAIARWQERIEPVEAAGGRLPSDPTRQRRLRARLRGRTAGAGLSQTAPRLWAGWNGAWPAGRGSAGPDGPADPRCSFAYSSPSALPPAALGLGASKAHPRSLPAGTAVLRQPAFLPGAGAAFGSAGLSLTVSASAFFLRGARFLGAAWLRPRRLH